MSGLDSRGVGGWWLVVVVVGGWWLVVGGREFAGEAWLVVASADSLVGSFCFDATPYNDKMYLPKLS